MMGIMTNIPPTHRLPPQNIEAEESVLGALMIDRDAVIQVTDSLLSGDFYKPSHNIIFEAVVRLSERQEPVDVLSVTNKLKEMNKLEEVGGSSYLAMIMDRVPSASHAEHYAKIVKEKKILRDLINASAEISEIAFKPNDDVDVILDRVEQKIFSISQRSISARFASLHEELRTAYERIEKLHQGEGKMRGVPTGFAGIDDILSGLQSSDLIVIGARPSVGKTTFALDIARHVATVQKQPVGIFSLEMSKEQVVDRLISQEANVPLWKLRTGRLKDDLDFQMIQAGLDSLSHAPLFIDDTPSPHILQMRSMARRLQAERGLALIVIDYLQLITPRTTSDNVVSQVSEISRGLKGLARELNVPVLALSQLSRGVDSREIKIPRLSDLRDSGSIEQDSDVVMFIYRKDKEKINPDPEDQGVTEIIIAKHRNGPLGTVKLKFDQDQVSFKTIDTFHNPSSSRMPYAS